MPPQSPCPLLPESPPERTAGHVDSGSDATFRMTGVMLPYWREIFQILLRNGITRQMQLRVKESGSVAGSQNKAVTVEPLGFGERPEKT